MGNENLLPKNIRQIGEIQGRQKIYLEDYVVTYIQKMEKRRSGNFLGILLGERKYTEDTEYVFVRGIMEIPDEAEAVQSGGEDTGIKQEKEKEAVKKKPKDEPEVPEGRWERLHRERETYFPGNQAVGSCVIGTCETARMEELAQQIPETKQMLYHLQDQEERLYWLDGERYEGIGGYFVFYEQNRQMQEYLSELFGESSVEKESAPDKAIISFREKVKSKAEEKSRSFLKLASSFFVVGALLVGVIAVNRVSDLRQAADVAGTSNASLEEAQDSRSDFEETSSDETAAGTVSETISEAADSANTEEAASADILAGSDAFWADDETAEMTASETIDDTSETSDAEPASDTNVGSDTEPASDTNAGSDTEPASDTNAGSDTESASDTGGTSDTETVVTAASRQVQASYVIRTGDTLAEICAKYYGSLDRLEELCEANGIDDADLILPGQKIVLP